MVSVPPPNSTDEMGSLFVTETVIAPHLCPAFTQTSVCCTHVIYTESMCCLIVKETLKAHKAHEAPSELQDLF